MLSVPASVKIHGLAARGEKATEVATEVQCRPSSTRLNTKVPNGQGWVAHGRKDRRRGGAAGCSPEDGSCREAENNTLKPWRSPPHPTRSGKPIPESLVLSPSSKPVIGAALLREAGLPPHAETGSGLIFHPKEREVETRNQTPGASCSCRFKLGHYLTFCWGGDDAVPVGWLAWYTFTGHTNSVVRTFIHLHLPVMASSDWNQISNDSDTPGFRK
ncbi:hypothetical protein STEG23_038171 [Scotinomys teguina]